MTDNESFTPRSMQRRGFCTTGMMSLAGAALGHCLSANAEEASPRLDLGKYRLTFSEHFQDFSISAWGPGTQWIAHTPWNGDFGDARFVDPRPGFPFTVDNGVLRIEARKQADGKWESGLICSADPHGHGFSQRYGYFEMRAKLPPGPGVWPAFWLAGNSVGEIGAEVDVLEYYGAFPDVYHTVLHLWPKDKSIKPVEEDHLVHVPYGTMSKSFHNYGVDIDSEWTTFYFDHDMVHRSKTPPAFDQPLFILANLALGSGWPIDKTPSPSYMYIEHIAVYVRESVRQ